jgi:hypothetical protein
MSVGKIGRTRKQPTKSTAQRQRMLVTLALKTYHLLEDAEQRQLFSCSTAHMRDNGQTCVGAVREGRSPEDVLKLALDTRLCQGCAAWIALRLASTKIDRIAGRTS